MVEVLTAFGLSAKELFAYNRDYYAFDQKQRLDREMLRLEMQVKRFNLFREDIRDLVDLTTSKMEMYHMVGALCLEFCVSIYTEGAEIAWIAPAPPFLKACWAMSLASAFCYIVLAVWLSMHASVSAHSFGVRLLTRFVRLPIPGSQQVNALNARLTDFEQQGINNALRVPFIGQAQKWQQRRVEDPNDNSEGGNMDHDTRFKPAVKVDHELRAQDLLGQGEVGINDHDLTDAATRLPGHHVQLFRRLQAKWQCYDTYARVCMSLGAYQLLAGISYYLLIATMTHYHSYTCGYAVVTIFVVAELVLGLLDIGRKMMFTIIALQLFGSIPIYLAAYCLSSTIFLNLEEHHQYPYPASPAIFILTALWHEGLLHFAWPSNDGMSLPRRFRTVLFIDVFAVADEALKSHNAAPDGQETTKPVVAEGANYSEEQVMAAEEAVFDAEAALRRWQAVPAGTVEAKAQGAEIAQLRKKLLVTRKMLNGEAARLAHKMGDQEAIALLEIDTRAWADLSEEEQDKDPFKGSLLGPFKHATEGTSYYYDLESREFVWQADEGREVLTIEELEELVRTAQREVRAVLGGGSACDIDDDDDDMDGGDTATDAEKTAQKRTDGPAGLIFTPQRLPWKAVNFVTRILVFSWAFLGVMCWFEQRLDDSRDRWDTFVVAEERRLTSAWNFRSIEIQLPHVALFRPSSLSCLGGGQNSTPELLVVGADGGAIRASSSSSAAEPSAAAGWASEALSEAEVPAGAAAFCSSVEPSEALPAEPLSTSLRSAGEVVHARCLMGAPTETGIALWSPSDEPDGGLRHLEIAGPAWTTVAGAAVPCRAVEGMLVDAMENASWCLLLVGWDGSQLPVAALPLSAGPGSLPRPGVGITPVFDAPLNALRAAPHTSEAVVAMHVEPRRGRLWAVLGSGALQAWELLGDSPRGLGRWSVDFSVATSGASIAERAVAVCEDAAAGELVVATRAAAGSLAPAARLLASPLPRSLLLAARAPPPPLAAAW